MVRPDSGQARPTCSANQAGGVAGSQSDLRAGCLGVARLVARPGVTTVSYFCFTFRSRILELSIIYTGIDQTLVINRNAGS